ncbi:nucleoplasmin-like protein ANO39 isoform X2 [Halichondria panicea]|uniref:nucleoplasmin-like protein ANO39 isoform X2 n=1 Tax=Halichondria panicea TaxID=6063 RepID=UPI00312B4044
MDPQESIGKQSLEEFWGAELSSKQKKITWQDEDDDEDEDMAGIVIDKTLELRQACLGASAKDGERNVVQVVAENDEGEKVKHTILSLRVGGTEQCSLFLSLNPPITFELVSGSGPVHIVGSCVETMNTFDDLDDTSSSEDDEDVEVPSLEVKALVNSAKKKRPADSPVAKPAKQMKLEKSSDESTADNSMDTSGSIAKRNKKRHVIQEEPEESDDDDDDDLSDDDDVDMSDDDEVSDDEEEVEDVKPPTKKPQAKSNGKPNNNNGKPKQKGQDLLKSKVFKTPQPPKQAPKSTKGTMSAPTTPKQKGNVKNTGSKKRNKP